MEEIIDGYAEWQNRPDLTGIGRMPERAAFFRYADKREALSEAGLQSARCMPLNGKWRFRLYPNHQKRPEGFADPNFRAAGYNTIEVPGSALCAGGNESGGVLPQKLSAPCRLGGETRFSPI